jgi:hypothetical protein
VICVTNIVFNNNTCTWNTRTRQTERIALEFACVHRTNIQAGHSKVDTKKLSTRSSQE